MELWNKVCKTDPKYTKKMTHGAKLTAVCAMSQVQAATEQFGKAGEGWGWTYSEPIFPPNGTVIVKCTLWHGSKENTIEQFGQKNLNNSKGADEDALKKAGTDALTKCLSNLGFNADIFLGKFDDSKYVEELRQQAQLEEREQKAQSFANDFMNKINDCKDEREVINLETDNAKMLKGLEKYEVIYKAVAQCITDKKASFVQSPTEAMQ